VLFESTYLKNGLNISVKPNYSNRTTSLLWFQLWNASIVSRLTYFYLPNNFFASVSFVQICSIWLNLLGKDYYLHQNFMFPQRSKPTLRQRKGSSFRKLPKPFFNQLVPFGVKTNYRWLKSERIFRKAQTQIHFRTTLKPRTSVLYHRHFENYSSLFQSTVFKMITPYIRVASQLIGIFPEEARRMTIRWRALQRNLADLKRASFLLLLSNLHKKVKITSLALKYYPYSDKYIRSRTDYKLTKRPKYHIMPRQNAYLYTRGRVDLRAHGSLHRLLKRRVRRIYRLKMRRFNTRALNVRLKSRNLKHYWYYPSTLRRQKNVWNVNLFCKKKSTSLSSTSVLNRRKRLLWPTLRVFNVKLRSRLKKRQSAISLTRYTSATRSKPYSDKITSFRRVVSKIMYRNKRNFRRHARKSRRRPTLTRRRFTLSRRRRKLRFTRLLRKYRTSQVLARNISWSVSRPLTFRDCIMSHLVSLEPSGESINGNIQEDVLASYYKLNRFTYPPLSAQPHQHPLTNVVNNLISSYNTSLSMSVRKWAFWAFPRRELCRRPTPLEVVKKLNLCTPPHRDHERLQIVFSNLDKCLPQRLSYLFSKHTFCTPTRFRKRQKLSDGIKMRVKAPLLQLGKVGTKPELFYYPFYGDSADKVANKCCILLNHLRRWGAQILPQTSVSNLIFNFSRHAERQNLLGSYNLLRRPPFRSSFYFEMWTPLHYKSTFKVLFSQFFGASLQINPLGHTVHTPETLSFSSQYKTPFIFSMFGFLYVQANKSYTILQEKNSWTYSRIQRHRYSFFYKNDVKRFYLRRAGKLKLLSSFIDPINFLNHTVLHKNLFKNYLNPITGLYSQPSGGTIAASHLRTDGRTHGDSLTTSRYTKYTNYVGSSEPHIKRIRFKPGYSRIWRNARTAINYSLGLHLRYQYRLTARLQRYSSIRTHAQMKLRNWSLLRLVLQTHFVYDLNTSLSMIQSNLIFINGLCSINPRMQLHLGDFVQIPVDLKYYVLHRWLINFNLHNQLRLTKLSQSKNNKSRYDISKQKSHHLPDWIFGAGYRIMDIPKYLEVDYFTLSAFIILEPTSELDFNPLQHLEDRTTILRMYNWKYIN